MGAWIEIFKQYYKFNKFRVAPHDGCVDWNNIVERNNQLKYMSHPTMGAWIEMTMGVGL